eukprot:scaffold321349_cov30-Tisochrysis_lutea.AAC.1
MVGVNNPNYCISRPLYGTRPTPTFSGDHVPSGVLPVPYCTRSSSGHDADDLSTTGMTAPPRRT